MWFNLYGFPGCLGNKEKKQKKRRARYQNGGPDDGGQGYPVGEGHEPALEGPGEEKQGDEKGEERPITYDLVY